MKPGIWYLPGAKRILLFPRKGGKFVTVWAWTTEEYRILDKLSSKNPGKSKLLTFFDRL